MTPTPPPPSDTSGGRSVRRLPCKSPTTKPTSEMQGYKKTITELPGQPPNSEKKCKNILRQRSSEKRVNYLTSPKRRRRRRVERWLTDSECSSLAEGGGGVEHQLAPTATVLLLLPLAFLLFLLTFLLVLSCYFFFLPFRSCYFYCP